MIVGGENLVAAAPAFSADGKRLLVCTRRTVSVFSTATGSLVAELEGHTDRVTSVIVSPAAAASGKFGSYCWTSSLDGTIGYWDFAALELIRRVEVGLPIHSMVIHIAKVANDSDASTQYAFVSVEDTAKPLKEKSLRGKILLYNLERSRCVGGLLAETRKPERITISKSGEFFGIKNKRKIHTWKLPTKDFKFDDIKKVLLHHTKNFSTLAFHPTERIVAAGDVTGRILIWRDFGKIKFSNIARHQNIKTDEVYEESPGVWGNDDADSCSTWHWHTCEVKFLFFSSDGAYLFSGGREGVIVVWQLDTGKRKFKPRLGSPLLFFVDSPDRSLSCVSCADNRIHILKTPTLEISKSISGIKPPFTSSDPDLGIPAEYAFDHHNGLVALRAGDYSLQFFNLLENSEVLQVQVCERNFHPVDEMMVYVSLVALSSDCSLMCTVDVRLPEEGLGGSVTLKFWTCSCAGEFSLSTIIYEPHSGALVSSVAFRPGKRMAVSSSFGGTFKVWVYSGEKSKDQFHDRKSWRCQSVGSYKNRQMTSAAFSYDGSVLAVAAENEITLWDPDTNILVAVIGEALSPITKLAFLGMSEYIVSSSQNSNPHLAVWNASNLSLHWSYKLFTEAVCCMEKGSQFAVLALLSNACDGSSTDRDGVILLFNVQDPLPVKTWLVKKAKGGGIAFIEDPSLHLHSENKEPASLLVYIDGDHEYIVFDPINDEDLQPVTHVRRRTVHDEESGPVGYAAIYGELPKLKYDVSAIPFAPSDRPWETIFSGSSHVLPPLTKLCSTFLSSLLQKRPAASAESLMSD